MPRGKQMSKLGSVPDDHAHKQVCRGWAYSCVVQSFPGAHVGAGGHPLLGWGAWDQKIDSSLLFMA